MTKKKSTILTPVEGYERLESVLLSAHAQASSGKGKARHANDLPFDEQPMQAIADQVGPGFLSGQAIKKIIESQSMDTPAAKAELLGAINYLAGLIIHLEDRE